MTNYTDTIAMMGRAARTASLALSECPSSLKDTALRAAATAVRNALPDILSANALDMKAAKEAGKPDSFLDRLMLDESRVEDIAISLDQIAALPDPTERVLKEWTRDDGLEFQKVSVPIGVLGIIYESRPNVTADAAALCLKSGNGAILRGGSDSFHSANAIFAALKDAFAQSGVPDGLVHLIDTPDRDAVGALLKAASDVDVIVPRGGKSLIERIMAESRIPVFAHLDGICHVYVDKDADKQKALDVVYNSKLRRTGTCNAAETLLLHKDLAEDTSKEIVANLLDAGCRMFGDKKSKNLDSRITPATDEDWKTEYLDSKISIRIVDNSAQAIEHINHYGSHHTDAIITENDETARLFMNMVDSGSVMRNASTQFADGGQYGFGAEIGISTGKLHARGPVGPEQLTSYKYLVTGDGHTRD